MIDIIIENVEKFSNVKKVVTHGGVYHADDVISAIILKLAGIVKDYSEIQRVSNITPEEITSEVLVFDIGNGRFDHHQKEVKLHKDGTKYSAVTLICKELMDEESFSIFYKNFLRDIELCDNTGMKNHPSIINAIVNHAFQQKKSFSSICQKLESIIEIELWHVEREVVENDKIAKIIKENPGLKIYKLEEHLPNYKFAGSSIKYLVEKSPRGTWNLITTSDAIKIPQEVKNFPGCTFVHAAGFMAAFSSEDEAVNAANKLLG